eukprot:5893553-Prymnesium_polylepis.1
MPKAPLILFPRAASPSELPCARAARPRTAWSHAASLGLARTLVKLKLQRQLNVVRQSRILVVPRVGASQHDDT